MVPVTSRLCCIASRVAVQSFACLAVIGSVVRVAVGRNVPTSYCWRRHYCLLLLRLQYISTLHFNPNVLPWLQYTLYHTFGYVYGKSTQFLWKAIGGGLMSLVPAMTYTLKVGGSAFPRLRSFSHEIISSTVLIISSIVV